MLDGIFPWSAPVAGLPVVLSVAVARQYLSGFLIGCGVGGVVGASTLGVAMFSLSAPTGELKNFTGIDSPYEAPENAEIRVNTTDMTPAEAADYIIKQIMPLK